MGGLRVKNEKKAHKYKVGDTLTKGEDGRAKGEFTVAALDWAGNRPFYYGDSSIAAGGVWEDDVLGRANNAVDHPAHYNSHPSGVECITIARHHNFNIGNVFKYLWRIGLKGGKAAGKKQRLQEIDKAIFYLNDERARIVAEG